MRDSMVIVGPGKMGLSLGGAFLHSGAVERLVFHGRRAEAPPHPIFGSEGGGAEYQEGPRPIPPGTTVLLLAVPDDVLGEVAQQIARAGSAPAGCVALHLAGALTTDVLSPLHSAGFSVGSFHPLQAAADPWSASDRLVGSSFAVAGEPSAIATARRLAMALDGAVLVVPPVLRPLYHASATVASNYLVTLVRAAVRLLSRTGVDEADALAAVLPLMRGTLENMETLGVSASLTGPIARGDVDTVRLHLARLSPEDRPLYCALGLETLRLARSAGLEEGKADRLERLLSDRS